MATSQGASVDDEFEKDKVQRIEREQLAWSNIYRLKRDINKADREEKDVRQKIVQLGRDEAKNAIEYKDTTEAIKQYQKDLQHAKEVGNRQSINFYRREIEAEQKKLVEQRKTAGGALMAISLESKKKRESLQVERSLIKDINKERGLGAKIMDLFRSKEKTQRTIDIARAKAGGGSNLGAKVGATAPTAGAPAGRNLGPVVAAGSVLLNMAKAAGEELKKGMVASLADAAALLTGEGVGMGGGKINAGKATSILGGLSNVLKTVPLIGDALAGLVDAFKAIADAVLGIDQANFRVARSLNISVKEADLMRKNFDKVAFASDNIVINSTRMLQSQIEISDQLGINKQLSDDILTNDVKLRDILGLEAESRKVISDQAIVTGRNAKELTKSAIGTVGAFNKLVGTSFKWSSILSEASKLTGVMGLTLTKFPEKIYNAVTATKALGFDLKQLDSTASSFLDFESSISAEFEAQVITGKDMNLTLARQAALNNDNVTLAKEITKNIGSAADYLNMNRIAQESIAKSVGMTRDGLADVLKKQEIYRRASVADEKGLVAKLDLLEQQKKTREEISAILGKDGYETATQVSTAEKLTEVMEKIKKTFVEFIRNSGLFDFLTDDAKINKFIVRITDTLSGAVSMIGKIIADILRVMSHIPGFDKATYQGYADSVEAGSMNFADTIKASSASLGGTPANSIGETVNKGAAQQNTQAVTTGKQQEAAPVYTFHHVTQLDGQVLTNSVTKGVLTTPGKGNGIQ